MRLNNPHDSQPARRRPNPRIITAVLVLTFASGTCYQSLAVHGFSVSASEPACVERWPYFGSIVKYTIQNSIVTRCDTIYKDHWAGFPVLNVQGTGIAFVRRAISNLGQIPDQDQQCYISVMDTDGGNVRDLDTLSTRWWAMILLDWGADRLYYTKLSCFTYISEDPCTQIWRVRDNDPASKELVCSYNKAGTWAISLDETKASYTISSGSYAARQDGEYGLLSVPHEFPAKSRYPWDLVGKWPDEVLRMCGSYISPSGNHHWHFKDGGHNTIRVNSMNWTNSSSTTQEINTANVLAPWTGLPQDTVHAGSHAWGRWAVNSDKWICGSMTNRPDANDRFNRGNNQILVNWVDRTAICTSRNSKLVNGCPIHSDPGDFWVAGGPGGTTYEDVHGNWIDVKSGRNVRAAWGSRRGLHEGMTIPVTGGTQVHSLLGRLLDARNRTGHSPTAGVYFIAATSGGRATVSLTQCATSHR